MECRFDVRWRACLRLLFIAGLSGAALADAPRERTQFGRDVSVGPGEVVSEVTCFGCSVRVRGHVAGDVTTFGGSVVVEDAGAISGDTTTFGGNVSLETTGKIGGDLTVFGGRIHRDAQSAIGGDVTNFSGGFWLALIAGLPLILLGGFVALIVWLVKRLTRPGVPATA
jgi:hypothetical protein